MIRYQADIGVGAWIGPRLGGETGLVWSCIPSGFAAYARIFHPAYDDGTEVTWGQVAAARGRPSHPLMQFSQISGLPQTGGSSFPESGVFAGSRPMTGMLVPGKLATLGRLLSAHTATGLECFYALWEGYAWIAAGHAEPEFEMREDRLTPEQEAAQQAWEQRVKRPAFDSRVLAGPRLELSGRGYLLFGGVLQELRRPPWRGFHPFAGEQSPNLIWPSDQSWCVVTDIDFDSTLLGGSEALIDAVIGSDELEAATVAIRDRLPHDGPRINRR